MVLVEARVHSTAGYLSGWKLIGAWSTRDAKIRRKDGGHEGNRAHERKEDKGSVAVIGVALAEQGEDPPP